MAPKKLHIKAFEASLPKHVVLEKVPYAAHVTNMLATTITRAVRTWKITEVMRIQTACQSQSEVNSKLVLGINDFEIRKGHTHYIGI